MTTWAIIVGYSVAAVYTWIRIFNIHEYKFLMLQKAYLAARMEVADWELACLRMQEYTLRPPTTQWRMDAALNVNNLKMLFMFWRPLPSFYPDTRFIEYTRKFKIEDGIIVPPGQHQGLDT